MLKSNKNYNFDGVCRACLGKSVNNKISVQTQNVKDLFQSCSGLKIKEELDLLPKFLCQSCYTKCNEWKIFKKLCESSEKYLIKTISKRETRILKVDVETVSKDCDEDLEGHYIHTSLHMTTPLSIEPVSCFICDKLYLGEKELLDHQRQQHTVQIPQQAQLKFRKIYQCHIGQNVPKKQDGLKKPMLTHICRVCKKSFRAILTLKKHAVTHTNKINFVCNECGKRFLTSVGLNEHQLSHTDLRPLECINLDPSS